MIVTERLNTQEIILQKKTVAGTDWGEREGQIRSDNYVSGVSGFRLRYSGDVEFNNGVFRGKLEAATGTFKGELQAATGTFSGEFQSGGSWDSNGQPMTNTSNIYAKSGRVSLVNPTLYGQCVLGSPSPVNSAINSLITYLGYRVSDKRVLR